MNIVVIHEVGYLSKPVYEYQDFAERLAFLGHTVTVIDFDEAVRGSFLIRQVSKTGLSKVRLISLPNLRIPILSILYARIRFKIEFRKLLSNQEIDAVFLYSIFINGVDAVKICNQFGIRIVYRAIDAYHRLRKSPWQSWLLKLGESFVYRNVSLIAVTNNKMAQYVRQIAGTKCVETVVLDHGVDTTHFQKLVADDTFVNQFGINPNEFTVIFLGTTYGFSQLDELIANIPDINQQIVHFKLLIVGAGELDDVISAQIQAFGLEKQVICCGMVDYADLPKYLSLARLAILPFQINKITKDIVPIKMLQYLSSSLPVVSTPLPDVINHFPATISGVVYSSSDEMSDFVKTMVTTILVDNLEELSKSARRFVSAHYSIEAATKHLVKILSDS